MVKYSVIVRTHDEGEELRKTVDSVLKQSIHDWEMILLDDGSGEETRKIADECGQLDSRIRVIHQENKGAIGVFLRGVKESKGEYIGLLDAGDYYDAAFLSEADRILSREDEKIDMILFGLREVFSDHEDIFFLDTQESYYDTRELFCIMERTISFFGLALRVTRRSVFAYTEKEKEFYEEVGNSGNFGEDLYLLAPILRNCRRVYVSHQPLYNYVYDAYSLSHYFPSYTWEDAWNRNRLLGFVYRTMDQCGWLDEELTNYIRRHVITLLAPCAKWIVRHFVRDREVQRRFRKDAFFNQVVAKGGFGKDIIKEGKSRFAIRLFCMRVRFL